MTVLLPISGTDLAPLVKSLDADRWSRILAGLHDSHGMPLFLPKFTLQYSLTMNQVLADLGMGIAFGPAADFTNISPAGGLAISRVQHKAWVDVNEEGTEAAAATVVGMLLVGGLRNELRIDRPFLFMIRERYSGTILFMGKVTSPA
jgi:serpin B